MENIYKLAPINQDFIDRLNNSKVENVMPLSMEQPNNEIPPTVIIPKSNQNINEALGDFPSRYDLRDFSRVSSVKDQGNIGSCWAFATYGSLESTLLPIDEFDFSENNLINNHGFDLGPNAGGNEQMSSAYLLRWDGPVNEMDDPYTGVIHPSPGGLVPSRHIQEVRLFQARSSPLDNDSIKKNLMDYGAIHCSMRWEGFFYNNETFSYYNFGSSSTNHGITVVGWDDNFPKENFLSTPPGNGAFIVKNSWGESFGENGYFYISYYDNSFQPRALYRRGESTNNYSNIYQYDKYGFLNYFWEGPANEIGYVANIFTATKNEYIKAVGFYTLSSYTSCGIEVYKNCTGAPNSGILVSKKNYISTMVGYQTVELDNEVFINDGEKFSILIGLFTPGDGAKFACEFKINGYSSGVVINKGESFFGYSKYDLMDLSLFNGGDGIIGNLCIKAYTVDSIHDPTVYIDAPDNIITICSSIESGEFDVDISIKDFKIGNSLLGFRSVVKFDFTKLKVLSVTTPNNSFMNPILNPAIINVNQDNIEYLAARTLTTTTLSSGVMYRARFKALNPGTTVITNSICDLRDESGNYIYSNCDSDMVTIIKTTPIIQGDFNNDGVIDFEDLLLFAKAYNHRRGDVGWLDYIPSEFGTPYADKDIGPAANTPPNLIMMPDNVVDDIDYNVFLTIWNYNN